MLTQFKILFYLSCNLNGPIQDQDWIDKDWVRPSGPTREQETGCLLDRPDADNASEHLKNALELPVNIIRDI